MKQPAKQFRRMVAISDEEMWEEIRQAFPEDGVPSQPSLAADFKVIGPAATADEIERRLGSCGGLLPASYLDFLRCSNGAAGCISDQDGSYLTLWGSEEVTANNAALPAAGATPGMFVFGTDGRGGWIGFNCAVSADPDSWPVVWLGSGSPGGAGLRQLAPNFQAWQQGGFQMWPGGFVCGRG
jgi:hypothetical protein